MFGKYDSSVEENVFCIAYALQVCPARAPPITCDTDIFRPPRCQQRHGRLRWKVTDSVFEPSPNDSGGHRAGADVWTTSTAATTSLATSTDLPAVAVTCNRRRPWTVCDVVDCLLFFMALILFLCFMVSVIFALLTK